MKKRNKRIQAKHYGLFHAAMRIEIQDVKGAHRKECHACGDRPEERRLKVLLGSGRGATTEIYCNDCGSVWLEDHRVELERAQRRMLGEDICIRRIEDDGE